jgi:hypothetical protein
LQLSLCFSAFECKEFSRRSEEWEADFREVGERCHSPGDRDVSVKAYVFFSSPAQHGHVRQIEGLDALGQEPHATQQRLEQDDG